MRDKISKLQEKISSLTLESKQKQKEQQRENEKKLELEKKELEKELTEERAKSAELEKRLNPEQLVQLQQKIANLQGVIDKLPGLVDKEGKINEELLNLLTEALATPEKLGLEKLENETKEGEKSQSEKEILAELEGISEIKKIENIPDEKLSTLLDKFRKMKKWVSANNPEQREAALRNYSELKKVVDELGLEKYKRECIKEINDTLFLFGLKNTDLEGNEYIEFAETMQKKKTESEIDEFENKIIAHIGEQKGKYFFLNEAIEEGTKAVENKDSEKAEDVSERLEIMERLFPKIYYNRIKEVRILIRKIEELNQETKIIQK